MEGPLVVKLSIHSLDLFLSNFTVAQGTRLLLTVNQFLTNA